MLDPDRWRRALEIFQLALVTDVAGRDALLDHICYGDTAMRESVTQLLRAHTSAGEFLERPAALDLSLPSQTFAPDPPGGPGAAPRFAGTERFVLQRSLGEGGMGIVYEAHDTIRNQVVALKTMRDARPADIYHLKQEFRGLADIAHPHLVTLYELVADETQCFFTMEMVQGVDLLRYINEEHDLKARGDRIGRVFHQLAEGLSELHRRGKLHRDIKPSNVLVTADERVVILDFGLIADVLPERGDDHRQFAGTPAYLAPEDIAGARATEASDWYSVGITLYQALTGHVPFEGHFDEQLRRKRTTDPPEPATIATGVPAHLSAICMDLISRDVAPRLTGRNALRQLGSRLTPSAGMAGTLDDGVRTTFVGREEPLAVLNAQWIAVTREQQAAAVCVSGPSGIGKSALIRRFLAQLPSNDGPEAVVLRSRCYERETVPYKALDGIVDSVSRYLVALPAAELKTLLPRDAHALSRLFPVMFQVAAVAEQTGQDDAHDPVVLRRQAFAALREVLKAIAARQPLVFCIDDLHWADADSVLLLDELLRPPDAPAALTVLAFRSEEAMAKGFLQRLLQRSPSEGWVTLELGPMNEDDANQLVDARLPRGSGIGAAARARIAREAAGNPFFLEQLTEYVTRADARADQPATIGHILAAQFERLPSAARPFLQTLAVCGRPVAPALVYTAAGLAGDDRPLVSRLRSEHLLRSSGSAEQIEIYHDRIRHALASEISSGEVRRIHGSMAATLVAANLDDPDALFDHYRGAGDNALAATHGARAAARASAALAFDRACSLYRQALDLQPAAAEASEWKHLLATALANAGRPGDAAAMYDDASSVSSPITRIELQRRAAEQFLIGGQIDRGLGLMRTVLAAVGMRMAPGPRSALLSLLVRRAQLRLRGWRFTERAARDLAAADLFRIDTCLSVVKGLALVDAIRASDFQARHMLLALDAGEPRRVATAMAIEALMRGLDTSARDSPLADRARELGERVGDPHAIALSFLTAGMSALLVGEWRRATDLCARALTILSDRCVGVTWETNVAQNFFLGSLLFRGELRDVAQRLPALLATARERGNLYFETELRTRMNLVWLAADRPDEGEREAREAMARWSQKGFQRQHYNHVLAGVQTELYRGRGDAAWTLIDRNWPAMKRTQLFRIKFLRIEASYLRARAALLKAAVGPDGRGFLAVAHRDADRIEREGMAWANPIAWTLRAATAASAGHDDRARTELARAIDAFDGADMALYAAAGRRRLGALLGGDRGHEMVRQGDQWMAAQDVGNPGRLTAMLMPGFKEGVRADS